MARSFLLLLDSACSPFSCWFINHAHTSVNSLFIWHLFSETILSVPFVSCRSLGDAELFHLIETGIKSSPTLPQWPELFFHINYCKYTESKVQWRSHARKQLWDKSARESRDGRAGQKKKHQRKQLWRNSKVDQWSLLSYFPSLAAPTWTLLKNPSMAPWYP